MAYLNCYPGEVELWGECYNIETTTYLTLMNSGLTGNIPSEIGQLTNLIALYLHNNQLTGEIPSEIGNLVNLQWLTLNNNCLTGIIPESICNIYPNLQYPLEIEDNNLFPPYPDCLTEENIGEQGTSACDVWMECGFYCEQYNSGYGSGGDNPRACMDTGKQYGCNFHYIDCDPGELGGEGDCWSGCYCANPNAGCCPSGMETLPEQAINQCRNNNDCRTGSVCRRGQCILIPMDGITPIPRKIPKPKPTGRGYNRGGRVNTTNNRSRLSGRTQNNPKGKSKK